MAGDIFGTGRNCVFLLDGKSADLNRVEDKLVKKSKKVF
jgi:hypothetical protein